MIDLGDLGEFDPEEVAVALDGLPDHVVQLLTAGSSSVDGAAPTPLDEARIIDDKYRVRAHLEYLSNRLASAVTDVENGISRKITVSMPPRSGKSHLSSE